MKKAQEFRDNTAEELHAKLEDFRKELFLFKNQGKHDQKQTHLKKQKRKDIARLKTILREKELKNQKIEG